MRTKRQATESQKTAAAEKRARFKEFAQRVAAMSEDQRAELAARMPVIKADGTPYSPFNACLILSQFNGTPTIATGFKQWLAAGRVVRKGEHGIGIWVPIGRKGKAADGAELADSGEAKRPGFVMGYVFDVSQTDKVQPAV